MAWGAGAGAAGTRPGWRGSRRKTSAAAASHHFQNKKGLPSVLGRKGETRRRTRFRPKWRSSAFARVHPAPGSKRSVRDSCVRGSTTRGMESRGQAAGGAGYVGLEGRAWGRVCQDGSMLLICKELLPINERMRTPGGSAEMAGRGAFGKENTPLASEHMENAVEPH